MNTIQDILRDVKIPRMYRVKQHLNDDRLQDVEQTVRDELSRPEIMATIHPGMRVCLTCSSRGVDNLALVLRTVARIVKEQGASPFIVPAMGSHGGATAEGQRAIAESIGVTQDYCECPILSSMETVRIGTCEDGIAVYIDKHAAQADGVIVIGRVKPHTSFIGPYESGIMKMMAIGLGKQYGASITHARGFGEMAHRVPMFGRTILKNANILFGLALVENAFEKTCIIKSLTREEIPRLEPGLLQEAKKRTPRIPFNACDVLIVDQLGKNISSDGMDPHITGRWAQPYKRDGGLNAERLVVLDISEESHGNASGVGMADITTRTLWEKIDFSAVYANAITCKVLRGGYVPIVMDSDLLAIQCGIQTCTQIAENGPRIIRIQDTLHVEEFEISEAMLEEATTNTALTIVDGPYAMRFSVEGALMKWEQSQPTSFER